MKTPLETRIMPPAVEQEWKQTLEEGAKVPIVIEEFDGRALSCLLEWGKNIQRYKPTTRGYAHLLVDIETNAKDGRLAYILPQEAFEHGPVIAYVKGENWKQWLLDCRDALQLDLPPQH